MNLIVAQLIPLTHLSYWRVRAPESSEGLQVFVFAPHHTPPQSSTAAKKPIDMARNCTQSGEGLDASFYEIAGLIEILNFSDPFLTLSDPF